MKRALIITCFISWSFPLLAQISFEHTYGGKENDNAMGVVVTTDGYLTAGSTRSADNTNFDIYLVKTDFYGDTLWTRIYGGPYNESAEDIIHSGDDTYIVCGSAWNSTDQKTDIYLIKINSDGDSIWTANDFSDLDTFGNSVSLTIDGLIVCGYSNLPSNVSAMSLHRISETGDLIWSGLYGGESGSVGTSVTSTPDGGFIACGYIDNYSPGWNRNIYLVKVSPSGDTLWTKQYAGPEYDAAFCVNMTFDGGYILTGYTFNLGAQNGDFILIKTNGLGEVEWQKVYGASGLDIGECGMQTTDGNFVFTGVTSEQGTELKQVYLVRTDPEGDTLWTRKFGDFPRNFGYDVTQTEDLGFIICGMSDNTIGNSYDALLIKTLPDGTVTGLIPPEEPARVNVWPNPFASGFIVKADHTVRRISMMDLSGKTVLQTEPAARSNEIKLGSGNLRPGIYVLEVTTTESTFYLKICKL